MPSKSGHSRVPICRVESNDLFDAIDNLARLKRHYDVCLFDCPNDFQLLVHITTISHRIHFFERLEVGQMFEDWRVPLFDNFPAKAVPEIFVEDDRANASALHQTG